MPQKYKKIYKIFKKIFFLKKSAPEGALSQNQDLRGIRGFFTLAPLGQTVSLCKRCGSNHPSEL